MNPDRIWSFVDAQRAEIAGLLDTLDDQQWMAPSLCDGWRVRDVAAHLTHFRTCRPPGRWSRR